MGFRAIVRTIAGRVFGFDRFANPVWNRLDGTQVALDTDVSNVPYIEVTTPSGTTRYTAGGSGGVTATVALNQILQLADPNTGAILYVNELDCWDINYYLTPTQIADTRRPGGPVVNLTSAIQAAHDFLVAKFSTEPTNKNGSLAGTLRFHHSYLVDGFQAWNQGIAIRGDNMRDTIFVQSATPSGDMFQVPGVNGSSTKNRAAYWMADDFSIIGTSSRLHAGAVCHGINIVSAPHDGLNYASILASRVSIVGMSGSCLTTALNRHAPKLRFCYFAQSGGVSVIGDGSDYASNVVMNADSDGEMLHCGSGGGNGHSVEINNTQTIQVNGGDYWASAHAELGYRAFHVTNIDYGLFKGFDCNGAFYYQGAGADTPAKSSQVRFVSINFRFRGSSFGDGDGGTDGLQPAPLDAYLITKDAVNTETIGCTYTPFYASAGAGGAVLARPRWIYSINGATGRHVAHDHLVDIASNDWPAGADALGALITATHQNSIVDDNSKLIMWLSAIQETSGKHGQLYQYLNFVDGRDSGIVGRTDGRSAGTGLVGEQMNSKVGSGATANLPTATNKNVVTLSSASSNLLTTGDWLVWGEVQFTSSTATTGTFVPTFARAAISQASGTNIPVTDATAYSAHALNIPTASALGIDFDCLKVGPTRITVTSTMATTGGATGLQLWLNASCTFTGTTTASAAAAFGEIRAIRTV